MTAETAAYIMMSGGGGQTVREDVIFHDILEKGVVLCTHVINNEFSFKVVGYYWLPGYSGRHSDLYEQAVTPSSEDTLNCGIREVDGSIQTNQSVSYCSSNIALEIHCVVYKNDVPLYSVRQSCAHTEFTEWIFRHSHYNDAENGNFYFKRREIISIVSASGSGTVVSPVTFTETIDSLTGTYVNGKYTGGGGFALTYIIQDYRTEYDSSTHRYSVVPDGSSRTDTSTVAASNGLRLLPETSNTAGLYRTHTDLDTEELIPVFQEVVDAIREEAGIDSFPVEIMEAE